MSSTMPPSPDHVLTALPPLPPPSPPAYRPPCPHGRALRPRDLVIVGLLRLAIVLGLGTAMGWCLVQGVSR